MCHYGARLAGDRIRRLSIGADDYVPKPFEPAELTLRINAILRRTLATRGEAPEIVTFGPFSFNSARGELSREGATVRLTEAEVALLRILAQRPGEVIRAKRTRQRFALSFPRFACNKELAVEYLQSQAVG